MRNVTHNKPRLTRECVRVGLYLLVWILVAVGTLVQVIVESSGLGARAIIATLAWFGGIVTYRLSTMLLTVYRRCCWHCGDPTGSQSHRSTRSAMEPWRPA